MLNKFNKREKYAVYLAAGFVCIFIMVQFLVFPVIDKRNRLKRMLQVKKQTLADMINLKSEYDSLRRQSEISTRQIAQRSRGFTLFSFLDELAGQAAVKNHITYMKPSTTVQKNSPYKISQVEMKLQGITLAQLTTYVYKVETSKNMVRIKRMTISRAGKEEELIDAVLQVEAFET